VSGVAKVSIILATKGRFSVPLLAWAMAAARRDRDNKGEVLVQIQDYKDNVFFIKVVN
jgi:hypothetical protein